MLDLDNACYNNDIELVLKIIDTNKIGKRDEKGNNALWWACHRNNTEIVKLLLTLKMV